MDSVNNQYTFTLYGEPVAKGRAHTHLWGGKFVTVTPDKTAWAEQDYKVQLLNAMGGVELPLFSRSVPVRMTATFLRPRPISLAKRVILPVTRPDLDNVTKTILDAATQFIYYDDSQITTMILRKRFGSPPRTELALDLDFLD